MRISIETNFPEVERALRAVQRDIATTVTARALNRTVEQARTAMSREIRDEFSLQAAYVRARLRIERARLRSGVLGLSASLIGGDGKRRAANVIAFGARQAGKGTSVRIKRTGGRKTIAGAFIANNGRTVFRRTGDKRLPIEPVQTIDVPQMFNARRIQAAVVAAIDMRFPAIFERELRFALSRLR